MKAIKDTRKSADYGMKTKANKFKSVLSPKSNNQCKKAGMNDARDTQHK